MIPRYHSLREPIGKLYLFGFDFLQFLQNRLCLHLQRPFKNPKRDCDRKYHEGTVHMRYLLPIEETKVFYVRFLKGKREVRTGKRNIPQDASTV